MDIMIEGEELYRTVINGSKNLYWINMNLIFRFFVLKYSALLFSISNVKGFMRI